MIIGNLALILALPASIASMLFSFFSHGKDSLAKDGKKFANITTALLTLASLSLIYAFMANMFSIHYVHEYSSISLPAIYKLCGIWAGLDGSILFWVWLTAIYTSLVLPKSRDLTTNAILQAVIIFFLITIIFDANPFALSLTKSADGQGLNPLLQNIFMLIHPPVLYLGYVGSAIPFAFAISALLNRDPLKNLNEHLPEIRFWMLLVWIFLTLGNLLGSMWAYVELGWGGFWAWDPVENAGILPWFTSCAFVHSVMMQEKRNLLTIWNIVLVILTFLMTIFGTFITRSGVIQSVHSFSDMKIGMFFLVFLAITTLFSFGLLLIKHKKLKSENRLESLRSVEGSFYINNILFILSLIGILWGTVLPLFAEWFTGRKIEVGADFFNKIMAPLGIGILFLTAICPQLSWRKWRKGLLRSEFLMPFVITHLSGFVLFFAGVKKRFALMAACGAIFGLIVIIREFARSVKIENTRFNTGSFTSFVGLFKRAPRRFGGYIVHVGVILMFLGIAGSSYKSEFHFKLSEGATQEAGGYQFTLKTLKMTHSKTSEGVVSDVLVTKAGKERAHLTPGLYLHKNQPKPIAEIDFNIEPFKDLYLSMNGVSDEGSADFALTVTPLISFIWIGGILMTLGALLSIFITRQKDLKNSISEEVELDVKLSRGNKVDFKTVALLILTLFPFSAGAVDTKSPHEEMAPVTGAITGAVLKDGKAPLPNQKIVLEIFKGHDLILSIPKTADAKGTFNFKNIFQSPEFSYSVTSEFEGEIYRTDMVSLKANEKEKKVDLLVGKGGTIDNRHELHEHEEETMPPIKSDAGNELKFTAIVLAIAVVLYALYRRKKG